MSFSSRKKKHTPSNSAPAIGLASHSQPVNPWSAHTPPLGQSPSPFPRYSHALSTTGTPAGELFLFGGYSHDHIRNDLYVFSTRDFSTTLLPTTVVERLGRRGHTKVEPRGVAHRGVLRHELTQQFANKIIPSAHIR